MPTSTTYLNQTAQCNTSLPVEGKYVTIDEEKFYKIANYDQMRPFFMSLVSHTDHWLFISSKGGVTAGRKNENLALFPYYTDDKITDLSENTGSKTLFRINKNNKVFLWEPFSDKNKGVYSTQRNLYKNVAGNTIIFEETNDDLQITFRVKWQFSEKYGFVKTSELQNLDDKQVSLEILDGIQNILPYGVGANLQNNTSNLVNAYKKNELVSMAKLGIYSLSAMIIDKAEPSEALKATTVWSTGIKPTKILLSDLQLDQFRRGEILKTETDQRAEKGAYFIKSPLTLKKNQGWRWYFVAEVNQDHADVYAMIDHLKNDPNKIVESLKADIEEGTQTLQKFVGMADGLQLTGDELSCGRHFSNVLFNIMRGGIFENGYTIEKADFEAHLKTVNTNTAEKHKAFLEKLPSEINYNELLKKAAATKDTDLIRICYEYLPLTFSRRHGDPSRPWNKFSIPGKNKDGTYIKNYEGNWRDIFQNWEALAYSFPGYVISMITKFVNASTIDGYNPYRITRNGIDWEVADPDDPWSFIGYWGDHQIIYLLKLMEIAKEFEQEQFSKLLTEKLYVYANVPYRIKSYEDIVKNPQSTIDFEVEKEKQILKKTAETGTDGKLVFDKNGKLIKAGLIEKMLNPLLAKLSNFIPEAGIWLNTQRPEWNDANNALVGNGVSMVTLYYMRRYVKFCLNLIEEQNKLNATLNQPVSDFMKEISTILKKHSALLQKNITDTKRKLITDELGKAGENYRKTAYSGFSNKTTSVSSNQLTSFLNLTLTYIDHSIAANKRKDGLYHAYNLIEFTKDKISIKPLYEMLEGQVAVLSSGYLSAKEALEVVDSLKQSKIYREDQYSYMLYPNRDLPKFLSKNLIPAKFVEKSKLAKSLLKEGNESIIVKDINGNYHFNGSFNNADSLKAALDNLKGTCFEKQAEKEYNDYLDIFEQLFNHKAFTGRSGTFFGYEGLGSIYWHMVSKLLLAVQENIIKTETETTDPKTTGKLIDHYYEIRAGIGINKSPDLYGAFPTDPYSHTPGNKGAQQPGMTGQVKEDILSRWGELGLRVKNGKISFDPSFINQDEFLSEETELKYYDINGVQQKIQLKQNELAFTFCQVPIIYKKTKTKEIEITYKNGKIETISGQTLSGQTSETIFNRTTQIILIRVKQSF